MEIISLQFFERLFSTYVNSYFGILVNVVEKPTTPLS